MSFELSLICDKCGAIGEATEAPGMRQLAKTRTELRKLAAENGWYHGSEYNPQAWQRAKDLCGTCMHRERDVREER